AVAFEAARGQLFRYEVSPGSCLVDADEEPPLPMDAEALDVALSVALLLHARPVDEIQVMRKIVIDGSNTTGFQRTSLVATDGWIEYGGRRIGIPTICLEEDAARKVAQGDGESRFRLDRLGIPLVEIATAPELTSGAEARGVAEEIGLLLRATRRVRRGIGTIREDLNVSVEGGTRVEIKGVQELRLLPQYVASERTRQETLLHVRDKLRARGAHLGESAVVELTDLLKGLASVPFRELANGGTALGLRLPGFAGLLGGSAGSTERLGRELAEYVRVTGTRGLLHSDELPGYGVDAERLEQLRARLGVGDEDGFVLVVAPSRARAEKAVGAARERAVLAIAGVPPETRDPLPDGRTRYSRPLPGRDRMYPETDVPPIAVDAERVERLRRSLPELPAVAATRLAGRYGLGTEVVRDLQRRDEVERFEHLASGPFTPALVARALTQDLDGAKALAPDSAREPTESELRELLTAVHEGRIAKEGIPPVLGALLAGGDSVERAIAASGLSGLSRGRLEEMAASIVARNAELVRRRGMNAVSPLMGELMAEVRGRWDGQEAAAVLRAAVEKSLAGSSA
ncbi:MAG TPA: Glu-tRNA(Gln) amidotransferase subunit GatE, partial [Thermoplasmata archaeon]|nr:Glu-tRNA(Gln) amidotransferase subunit GatE [Thermoplasmata archaeon]